MTNPPPDQPAPQQPPQPYGPQGQPHPYPQNPYPPHPYAPQGQPPPPQAGPPPQPAPVPRRRGRRVLVTVGSIVVALVVAFGVRAVFGALNGTASAQVGDCLAYTETDNRTRVVDCGSAEATQKIFGITTELRACADVAGTQVALEVGRERVLCFGEKNLDPATAINAAQEGDCLKLVGDRASKAACAAGTYPVLKLVKDRVKASADDDFATACTDVEGAEGAYAWSITTGENEPVGTWDRIFCLGAEKT